MILFKTTQDKVLAVLQSVCGIVERRHTMPILANVLLHKVGNAVQLTTAIWKFKSAPPPSWAATRATLPPPSARAS